MATHSSIELQAPDYIPSMNISDKGKFADFPNTMFNPVISSNIAMYKCVAKWMEWLKDNDCYDNTRVIIVADHGAGTFNFNNLFFYGGDTSALGEYAGKIDQEILKILESMLSGIKDGYPLDSNHPLLMVKDFADSASQRARELTVNDSFMTNADTPALAFEGIVPNPVNPWTGKAIERRTENAAQGVVAGGRYDPGKNGVYKFDLKGIKIYDVFDDMANYQNWKERKE